MTFHDSRNEFYRAPFGAQCCGVAVTFRLVCKELVDRVSLRLWWDGAEMLVPMHIEKPDVYITEHTLPDHPGLLWYHFVIALQDGRTVYYGNAYDQMGGEGAIYGQEPPSYQITVYDPRYETPDWMKSGVMYQIMVDRFCASKPVTERPAPYKGHWHTDWYEDPELNYDSTTTDNIASDFFGGDLRGIESKLPYLADLGVTVLYLSPIFQARSNHKYNTGDYKRIDPSFGTEADFKSLCASAEKLGLRVMLDGVFSHTGSDSRYFNMNDSYPGVGAYQSRRSQYFSWYNFSAWPDHYETWWGFSTLPVINKRDPSFLRYILHDDDSAFAHWLRAGASGWRLDVADELPMAMLREMRTRLKRENAVGALLGEVWEDASCKTAYDELRCYCLGDTLDSVMNYPLRDALFDFVLCKSDAALFARRMDNLREHYPPQFYHALMNLAGSHDKARAINVLSGAYEMEPMRKDRSARKLTDAEYVLGRARFLLVMQLIMAMPGMPCLYYGDEAGAQGMADPFCRGTFPWGREDKALQKKMRTMIHTRHGDALWSLGEMKIHAPHQDVVVIERTLEGKTMRCAVNRSAKQQTVMVNGVKLVVKGMGATMR